MTEKPASIHPDILPSPAADKLSEQLASLPSDILPSPFLHVPPASYAQSLQVDPPGIDEIDEDDELEDGGERIRNPIYGELRARKQLLKEADGIRSEWRRAKATQSLSASQLNELLYAEGLRRSIESGPRLYGVVAQHYLKPH